MDHQKLLKSATVTARRVEDIDRDELVAKLEEKGVTVVRGLITPQQVLAGKKRLAERFDPKNDRPATGESPADLYANLQKFSVNGGDWRANAHAQCVRSFYNPIFSEDIYGMRDLFRATAGLRNLMSHVRLDWAVDKIEDGFWTAARMHHYPAGGGFMAGHTEIHVPKVYEEAGLKIGYFQPLVVMSRRGTGPDCDFKTGGGFFERDGERVFYEDYCELGDILTYDTRVTHGVTEIDIHKRFRLDDLEGRFAAFVTLFRDFSAAKARAN